MIHLRKKVLAVTVVIVATLRLKLGAVRSNPVKRNPDYKTLESGYSRVRQNA